MNEKPCVAVFYGGFSAEREISLKSGRVVFEHLSDDKFRKYLVDVRREGMFVLTDDGEVPLCLQPFGFRAKGGYERFDVVFIAIHGTPGEDGVLQGLLDLLKIPYTTGGVLPMALTFSKAECNAYLGKMGVAVPKGIYATEFPGVEVVDKLLRYPLFVKPSKSGSSVGVSKVTSSDGLMSAYEAASKIDPLVLMEEMVSGIEVSCGVSDVFGQVKALEITEIVPAGDFFDFKAKYSGQSLEITPARIRSEASEFIKKTSESVFKMLGLRGLVRMDYIVPSEGEPVLLEINTVPGLSEQSILPKQAHYLGISLEELFSACIFSAMKKQPPWSE